MYLIYWTSGIPVEEPIPRDSVNKGMVAMLVEQAKEVWRKRLFMYTSMATMTQRENHQYGGFTSTG